MDQQSQSHLDEADLRRLKSLSPERKDLLYESLEAIRRGLEPPLLARGTPGAALSDASTQSPLAAPAAASFDAAPVPRSTIPRVRRDQTLPLSPSQLSLWYADQLRPGTTQYNMPMSALLRGRLNLRALEESLNLMIERHEVLRTCYNFEGGRPEQIVRADMKLRVGVADLRKYAPVEREQTARNLFTEQAITPFDLENGPILRANVVVLGDEEFLLILHIHHIACDGSSFAIMNAELWPCYDALCRGEQPEVRELPLQYLDFAAWQQFQPPEDVRLKQIDFWAEHLKGLDPARVPVDRLRPRISTTRNGIVHMVFAPALLEQLRALAQQEKASLFMVLLAGLKALIYRYAGTGDAALLSIVRGRGVPELEHLIGCFANPIILRTAVRGDVSFRELLLETRRSSLAAYENDALPFVSLLEEMRRRKFEGIPGIFVQHMRNPVQATEAGDLKITPLFYEEGVARQDLEFHFHEGDDSLRCLLLFNRDVYTDDTFFRFSEHYNHLLQNAVADPGTTVDRLRLAHADDVQRVLINAKPVATPSPVRNLAVLFAEQVARDPFGEALRADGQSWNYAQLNHLAGELADELRRRGVGLESRVGLLMDRGPEYVAAVLAVVRCGAAYVPLDPTYPAERLSFLVEDASIALILTESRRADRPEFLNIPWLTVSPRTVSAEQFDGRNPFEERSDLQLEDLACVMYTSGSTGEPRAVGVTHRGVARLALAEEIARTGEVFLQLAPLSFDASTFEIWGALLNGAVLVVPDPGMPSFEEVERWIERERVTTLWLSAGLFHQMVDARPESLRGVKRLWTGGDVVSTAHARRFLREAGETRLVNGYGPTENTTFTSAFTMHTSREVGDFVSIGRPISRTEVYLLDRNFAPVPVGVPGELYTAGAGLARGYLGRPALTAERFVPNPFADEPGARMYRTGDLARWMPDGNLQFLGRVDRQFKLNGYRIEPGEVESRLREHPAVADAAVAPVYNDRRDGNEYDATLHLKAYVAPVQGAPESEVLERELSAFLRARLPAYMVPAKMVFVSEMPVTANGKTDRWALLADEGARYIPQRLHVAPSNPTERKLAEIWSELMKIEPPGVRDDFFQLGGNSLLAIRMRTEIRKRLGKDLPLHVLLEESTIEHIARTLRSGFSKIHSGSLIALNASGTKPPFFCVHPAGGTSMCYLGLSRELGQDQPFYAFQSPGLHGSSRYYWSVQDLATHYVDTLRSVQPHGPYFLGGWSFGGQVAFEMTRRLEAEGEQVGLLALLDAPPPRTGSGPTAWQILTGVAGVVMALLQIRLRSYDDLFMLAQVAGLHLPAPDEVRHLEVEEILQYARDLTSDLPRIAGVAASHFVSGLLHTTEPDDFRKSVLFRAAPAGLASDAYVDGWHEVLPRDLQVQSVPGNHMTMLESPNVGALAERLRMWLGRARYSNE